MDPDIVAMHMGDDKRPWDEGLFDHRKDTVSTLGADSYRDLEQAGQSGPSLGNDGRRLRHARILCWADAVHLRILLWGRRFLDEGSEMTDDFYPARGSVLVVARLPSKSAARKESSA